MRVGIIAEGADDIAVLRNILKGKLGLDGSDSIALRPELYEDETDLAARGHREQSPDEFSNFALVFAECRSRTKIEDFLDSPLNEERFVIIHIDTAEAHKDEGYGFSLPDRKAADYFERMREAVIGKMEKLLGHELAKGVRYAIAIEETEAWLLTIHDEESKKDTGTYFDPKARLSRALGKASKGRNQSDARALSVAFRALKKLEACAKRNRSLRLFIDSL